MHGLGLNVDRISRDASKSLVKTQFSHTWILRAILWERQTGLDTEKIDFA